MATSYPSCICFTDMDSTTFCLYTTKLSAFRFSTYTLFLDWFATQSEISAMHTDQ